MIKTSKIIEMKISRDNFVEMMSRSLKEESTVQGV